jgi:hypothetical protein
MKNTSRCIAFAVTGAALLAPAAAHAQTAPNANLQGKLLSATSASPASGLATYHSDMLSNARQFDVALTGLPVQPSTAVQIFVHGDYLTNVPLTTNGDARIELHNGVPAMKNGWTIKVSTMSGKVLCSGVLHVALSTHAGGPTPAN